MRAPHHAGTHQRRAARIVAEANANPHTRCWRCHRTLNQHPPHHNGTPARWTAGHTTDGQINGELLPEASTCNYSAGATHGNTRRHRRWSRNW
jgi:hypothetical protein